MGIVKLDEFGMVHLGKESGGGGSDKANTSLSNLTDPGKGVIVDVATELDWANASAVAAVNTEYTAAKSGIVLIRAQASGSHSAGVIVWGPGMDGTDTGSNYISGIVNETSSGKSITSVMVTKGSKYMCYLQTGATLIYAKFVPFKNAAA